MGDSHYRSDVVALKGTETISGFANITCATLTATTVTIGGAVTAVGAVTAPSIRATSYIRIGASQYIFYGSVNYKASAIAEATALVSTPIKGSLYMSDKTGAMFAFVSDTVATPLSGPFSAG